MMFACDFIQRKASDFEKVLVGGTNGAIYIEFDDSLRFVDSGDLTFEIGVSQLGSGDFDCRHADLDGCSALIQDGIVSRLQPDNLAAFSNALIFAGVGFSGPQVIPESAILVRICDLGSTNML